MPLLPTQKTSTEILPPTHLPNPPAVCLQPLSLVSDSDLRQSLSWSLKKPVLSVCSIWGAVFVNVFPCLLIDSGPMRKYFWTNILTSHAVTLSVVTLSDVAKQFQMFSSIEQFLSSGRQYFTEPGLSRLSLKGSGWFLLAKGGLVLSQLCPGQGLCFSS